MKILAVSYAFFPRLSGVAVVVKSLYSNFIKIHPEKNTVTVLAFNDENLLAEKEIIDNLNVIRFSVPSLLSGRIPLFGLDFILKMWKLSSKKNCDQVHIHTRLSVISFVSFLIAKLRGQNIIHYEHLGNFIQGESAFVNNASFFWDQIISRIMFSFSDKIIAVSDSVKLFIVKEFKINPSKIVVIENGCDYTPAKSTFVEKFKNKKTIKKYNIFYGARFVPLKNPMIALESVLSLRKLRKNFHFYMAGNGKLEGEIKQFVKSNKMGKYVTLLGKLDAGGMEKQFKKSHFLLNISMLEGFPGIVLESIFSNVVPILTDICGNNDIIKNENLLISINNLNGDNLSSKINGIIENLEKDNEILNYLDKLKTKLKYKNTWPEVASRLNKLI